MQPALNWIESLNYTSNTVFLSFLKGERERFVHYSLPVVQRYNRSPFLTVCMNVQWAFSTVCDIFMTRKAQKRFRNEQERWGTVWNDYKITLQKRKKQNLLSSLMFNYQGLEFENWYSKQSLLVFINKLIFF